MFVRYSAGTWKSEEEKIKSTRNKHHQTNSVKNIYGKLTLCSIRREWSRICVKRTVT